MTNQVCVKCVAKRSALLTVSTAIVGAILFLFTLVPLAHAHPHHKPKYRLAGWELNGRLYTDRAACEKARDESKLRGTVIGAVSGAVIGGSVAEENKGLASGAGAVVGGVVGQKVSEGSRKQCKPHYVRR